MNIILIILLILLFFGGGYGFYSGNTAFGYGGVSIGTVLVVVLLILLLTGRL